MINISHAFWGVNGFGDARQKKSVQINGYTQEETLLNKRKLLAENPESTSVQNQKTEGLTQGEGTEETQESEEKNEEKKEESKTDTDIIVKPDGSRVLLVTTRVCGQQTTMSLEISKPTAMQNDISEEEEGIRTRGRISGEEDDRRTRGQMSKAFAAYEDGYLTGVMTGSEP